VEYLSTRNLAALFTAVAMAPPRCEPAYHVHRCRGGRL